GRTGGFTSRRRSSEWSPRVSCTAACAERTASCVPNCITITTNGASFAVDSAGRDESLQSSNWFSIRYQKAVYDLDDCRTPLDRGPRERHGWNSGDRGGALTESIRLGVGHDQGMGSRYRSVFRNRLRVRA